MKQKRSMVLVVLFLLIQLSFAATGDMVLLNEILGSHTGTDNCEYVELYGEPGYSLAGLSIIIIESDNQSSNGSIDKRYDFSSSHVIGENGFFLLGNPEGLGINYNVDPDANIAANFIENSSYTCALVQTASISGTRVTGAEVVLDVVGVSDGESAESFFFNAPVIGPDGNYLPAGVRRVEDGVDSDSEDDWVIGNFNLTEENTPTSSKESVGPTLTTIAQIQGEGSTSPVVGERVKVRGVVTLFTANEKNLWMQDLDGDGNDLTSEGIFVAIGSYDENTVKPALGDLVEVVASVQEQQYANQLSLTRLTSVQSLTVLEESIGMPEAVELTDLPNSSIEEAITLWESLEGMLVTFTDAKIVSATSKHGEFACLLPADTVAGSGYYSNSSQIAIRSLGGDRVDYNPEKILVDDGSLDNPIVVYPGDRFERFTGVVDYTFGNYKLQPKEFSYVNGEVSQTASVMLPSDDQFRVVSFNVENLFDLELNVPKIVDMVGEIGVDPGSSWGSGDVQTKDKTLRRDENILTGELSQFNESDWRGYAKDSFANLGVHSTVGTTDDIIISEYVEGSSNNKAIEIFNGTGAAIDLNREKYTIKIYFNGSNKAGRSISLSGTLANGETMVIAHSSSSAALKAKADMLSSNLSFNGDDAVVLSKGGKDDAGSTPTEEELAVKLSKLQSTIANELLLPEILVVQEAENQEILQVLGDRINATSGTQYRAVSFESSDGRGIENGFLFNESRVTLVEAHQAFGDDVDAAYGAESASPGREPIIGTFRVGEQQFTIIGNHFKSKGGDDPLYGVHQPPVRNTEVQRKLQAAVVRRCANDIFATDSNAKLILCGDLNDFQFAEPGEGTDHTVGILEGINGETTLENLINGVDEAVRFTYIYDGNSQVLDHMLVSPAMKTLMTGFEVLHVNASFPAHLVNDSTTTKRSSDHDPLIGQFVSGSVLPFEQGSAVSVGDIVSYKGSLYKCLYGHTMMAHWAPGSAGIYFWSEVTSNNAWKVNTFYNAGSLVSHKGNFWEALIDHWSYDATQFPGAHTRGILWKLK